MKPKETPSHAGLPESVQRALSEGRHAEERYRSLIDNISEAVWLFELEEPVPISLPEDEQIARFYQHAYLAEANDVMARMYGLETAREIIGKRLGELLVRDDPNNIAYLRAFIRSGYHLQNAESHEVDTSGNSKYFFNNLSAVVEDGLIKRAWGTQRDVTERKLYEESIRVAEQRLKLAVRQSDLIVYSQDRDLRYTWIFDGRGLFDPQQVIGTADWQLTTPEHSAALTAIKRRVLETRQAERAEFPVTLHDGLHYYDLIVEPDYSAAGDLIGISGTAVDVTQRKVAEAQQAHLAAIVASSIDAIFGKTLDAVVTSWNPAAESLFGYSAEEMVGSSIYRIVPPGAEDEIPAIMARIGEGDAIRALDTRRIRKDGSIVDVRLTVSPIRDARGQVIGASTISRDISGEKRAESERLRHLEEIETLNARLKRAMSETHHRVKNNLQIITAMIDMMAMRAEGPIPVDEVRDLSTHVRALALVHEILTSTARRQAEAETVSIHEILDRMLPLLERFSNGHRIVYDIDDVQLPIRHATSVALVTNELVQNAVKYGASPIEVRLRFNGRTSELRVRDHGPGFGSGFQPDHANSTGLELVLSLSRWDLGGTAEFRNHPSGGAEVIIRLPPQIVAARG